MTESCSGSAGSNEMLFTYNNEVAAYMDLEEKKLVIVPNVLLFIPGSDVLELITDEDPFAGLTPLCKDTYFRTLSFNVSEPLGKALFLLNN